ncbi:DNA helicase [Sporobolomyces koalae]|uniref:DNA helicase n=1 Tax=Sporobolomyces koalae TaxID=500713 RepID=UPI003179218F
MPQRADHYGQARTPPPSRTLFPSPTLIDEQGFQFAPAQSSSSVYDDPEELEYLREWRDEDAGFLAGSDGPEPFENSISSSPTPSPVAQHSSLPRASSLSHAAKTLCKPHESPDFVHRPPPRTDFSHDQLPESSTFAAQSHAFSGLSRGAGVDLASKPALAVIAPRPIRPMPMPLPAPVPFRPTARPATASQSQMSFQSTRRDTTMRADSGEDTAFRRTRGTDFQAAPVSRRQQLFNEAQAEEAHFWQDIPYDEVSASNDSGAKQDFSARSDARSALPSQGQPLVQYYDDLVPPDPISGPALVPVIPQAGNTRRTGDQLKPVNQLPSMFRSIWRFGVFNAVQSICFDSIYKSDENVVVSAPTGAGKTVLFELALIRLFTTSFADHSKALYVAPTRSLCAERASDWKKKFEAVLGWKVAELTGDSEIGSTIWREVAGARIIVTTPEKWDALTRRWHDHNRILSELQLFCVDEVHSVGTDVRGAVLEVVVSRMKTLGTFTRFVAVSATVPNIKDVALWLSNPSDGEPAKVFEFGEEFRPCPLQKIVYGYNKSSNDFAFAKNLNLELFSLVKKHSKGNPVLVFCSTRKGCLEAAEHLVKDFRASLDSAKHGQALAWPKPHRASYTINDKRLAALVENGVSIHHAGMEQSDRKLVEKLFIEGKISVICSTSTLAVGVNLPARMVIIRGTKGYSDGRMAEYADMDILQMLGRAGRPQFDRIGIACIMTEKENQRRFENLVNAQKKLESWFVMFRAPETMKKGESYASRFFSLHKNLTEHINSEITLRTITNVDSALHWLRSTFLYVRISRNSPYYAIANSGNTPPDTRLEEICVTSVKQLVDEGIVHTTEDGSLAPNEFGEIMSRFYISHPTFVALKAMPPGATMRTFLESLANAQEFSSFRLRQGEKAASVLAKANKMTRFPVEKVATTADRIMILIQLVLEGISGQEIKTDTVNPLLDANAIWSSAVRIAKGMFDLAVLQKDGSARVAMELLRSLNGRCWDNSSFVLRQLKGIGEKSYKALVEAGIRSFADVAAAPPDRLELILNRKPPYGSRLAEQARMFPQFKVGISIEHEDVRDEGVQIETQVSIELVKTKPPPITKKGVLNLHASVLVLTNDGHFIEFRRCPLAAIAKGSIKPFPVSVILVKPSQRIVVSVSCDLLAGSEVRAEVKPDSRASDFPIPVSQECENDTRRHADEPRRRDDGKYDCNHTCVDKTKCKHLCCREGLDKPPRRSAASKKRKVRSNSVDVDAAAAKPPSRHIPMKQSDGLSLTQDSTGKIGTRTKLREPSKSFEDEEIDELDEDDDDNAQYDLPDPDDFASGNNISRKTFGIFTKKTRGSRKHPVVAPFSRPLASIPEPTTFDDSPTLQDALVLPLVTPAPKKPTVAPFSGIAKLAMKRNDKLSLDMFESDSEDTGSNEQVSSADAGKIWEVDPTTLILSAKPVDSALSQSATSQAGKDPHTKVQAFGNAASRANAVAQTSIISPSTCNAHPGSFKSTGGEALGEIRSMTEARSKQNDEEELAETETRSGRKSDEQDNASESESEDDVFEAWLKKHVVITD